MRQLYLTFAETRRLYGAETYNRPSRFLQEIPRELLQEVRLRGAVHRTYGSSVGEATDVAADEQSLRIGQRVSHPKFGEGVVLQSEGHGDRVRVQVNFAAAGAKWLMLGYANLDILD
jgi:DNA helicase II / ATP-dependent DNA helicase PcrA